MAAKKSSKAKKAAAKKKKTARKKTATKKSPSKKKSKKVASKRPARKKAAKSAGITKKVAKTKTAKKKAATRKAATKKTATKKVAKKVTKAIAKKTRPTKTRAKKAGASKPTAKKSASKKPAVAAAKSNNPDVIEVVQPRVGPDAPPLPPPPPPPEPEVIVEPTLPPMPVMPARRSDGVIRLAYGVTPDQAFMMYALANEKVDTEDRQYDFFRAETHELADEARKGTFDISAVSVGMYPSIWARYLLLTCGCAFGDHRGPCLVARSPIRAHEVQGLHVAVPAEDDSASLALRLWLPRADLNLVPMPARQISLMVRAQKIRAGLLVNEDQVTYRDHNLVRVVDLGHWWAEETEGLPLALGINIIRRDIPFDDRKKIALDLKRSIAYALGHREEAVEWAMQFSPKLTSEQVDHYVSRYVNELSLDGGERGRQAVRLLFAELKRQGFRKDDVEPFFHDYDENEAEPA